MVQIKTVQIHDGLTLEISNPQLATELGKINQKSDDVINLEDFPASSPGETQKSRQKRMEETVVSAIRNSKIFSDEKQNQTMAKFFRSFEEKRKNTPVESLCFESKKDTLFQTSIIGALLQGGYEGNFPIGRLRSYGDLFVGTYNFLDGEMAGKRNRFYQIKGDGNAIIPSDRLTTPFAVTTFFEPDIRLFTRTKSYDLKELSAYIDGWLPDPTIFYAIEITGTFQRIKTRSVPAQEKPYPPFATVVQTQPTFELNNVRGTIVGFWNPDYMKDINATGYHFHFITADKKSGGHVLELQTDPEKGVDIFLDNTCNLKINL